MKANKVPRKDLMEAWLYNHYHDYEKLRETVSSFNLDEGESLKIMQIIKSLEPSAEEFSEAYDKFYKKKSKLIKNAKTKSRPIKNAKTIVFVSIVLVLATLLWMFVSDQQVPNNIPQEENQSIYSGGDTNLIEHIGGVTQQSAPATPRGYNIYSYYDGQSLWLHTDFEEALIVVSVNNMPYNMQSKNGWQIVTAVAVGDTIDIHGLKQFTIDQPGYVASIEYYKNFNPLATPNPPNTMGELRGSSNIVDSSGRPTSFVPVPIQGGMELVNAYNSGDANCVVKEVENGFVMTTASSMTTVKIIQTEEILQSVKYPEKEFYQSYGGDQYQGAWFIFRSEITHGSNFILSLQCYQGTLLLAEGNINVPDGTIVGMYSTINPWYSTYIQY